MKKISIFLISMVFFFGINTVSADTSTTYYLINENYSYEENFSFFTNFKEQLSKLYDNIYQYYLDNYQDTYPYYFIQFNTPTSSVLEDDVSAIEIYMYMYSSIPSIDFSNGEYFVYPDYLISNHYAVASDTYGLTPSIKNVNDILTKNGVFGLEYFYSNFDLILNDNLTITTKPGGKTFSFSSGDVYPIAQDLFELDIITDPDSSDSTYIEIDLNQYPYVALSLKDYTKRDTFYTNVYVKGNYCLTPVYNYGMTEKGEVLSGYKSQRCSTYYDNYTLVRTYILSQDIENNAIYYLKAYDTSKDNLVKVDTSVFDITYITEETQENPYVSITDKIYPTIAYDKLTSSATKSEDEDYISGVSCQVGDFNCYNENNPENIFDEVFSSPLNFLKGIWSSITSIFDIIGEFISLLPETMQSFLYLSFMIAVILGLLKIIL